MIDLRLKTMTTRQWQGMKQRPTQFATRKNMPGKISRQMWKTLLQGLALAKIPVAKTVDIVGTPEVL